MVRLTARHVATAAAVALLVAGCATSGGTAPVGTPTTTIFHDEDNHTHGSDTTVSPSVPATTPPAMIDTGLDAPKGYEGAFSTGGTQVLYYPDEIASLKKKVLQDLAGQGWTVERQVDGDGVWGFSATRDGDRLDGGVVSCANTVTAPDGTTVKACPDAFTPEGSRTQLTLSLKQ